MSDGVLQIFELIKWIAWPTVILCIGWWYHRPLTAITRRVAAVKVKDSEFTLYPESGEWPEQATLALPAKVELELEELDSDHGNTVRMPDSVYEGILAILVMHAIRTDDEDEYFPNLSRQLFSVLYRPECYRGRLMPAARMQKMARVVGLLSELRSVADSMDDEDVDGDSTDQE